MVHVLLCTVIITVDYLQQLEEKESEVKQLHAELTQASQDIALLIEQLQDANRYVNLMHLRIIIKN